MITSQHVCGHAHQKHLSCNPCIETSFSAPTQLRGHKWRCSELWQGPDRAERGWPQRGQQGWGLNVPDQMRCRSVTRPSQRGRWPRPRCERCHLERKARHALAMLWLNNKEGWKGLSFLAWDWWRVIFSIYDEKAEQWRTWRREMKSQLHTAGRRQSAWEMTLSHTGK